MVLQTQQLTKSFGDNLVLRGIDLKAQSGRALGLLGRNGAGKTTTIRIVMQVFRQDSGKVLLDGKPLQRDKLRIGYLPEERGMYQKKPILEQLVYFGMLAGLKKGEAKQNAKSLLKRLEMEEYTNRKLETLSKGNQQKIQFVATLIADPEIVILDEPFSGLDPVNAMLLKELVRELIQQDKIVFFSSHQMNYIEEFCDDIAILNQGEITLSGSIREIKRQTDRSKVVIQTQHVQELATFLYTLPQVVESVVQGQEAITVNMHKASQKQELLQAIAQQQIDLDTFRVYEPTVQDIFVAYTKDGEVSA